MATTGKVDLRDTLVVYHWVSGTQSLEARQVKIVVLPVASINRADRDRNTFNICNIWVLALENWVLILSQLSSYIILLCFLFFFTCSFLNIFSISVLLNILSEILFRNNY